MFRRRPTGLCTLILGAALLVDGCSGSVATLPERTYEALQGKGDSPAKTAERNDLADALLARLDESTRSRVRHDPLLDRVAIALIQRFDSRSPNWPAPIHIQWMGRTAGVTGTILFATDMAATEPHAGDTLRRGLYEAAQKAAATALPLTFGVARSEHSLLSPTQFQIVVFARADVAVDPVPTQLHAGETITVHGRFTTPRRSATLFADGEDGAVLRRHITSDIDDAFSFSWKAPSRSGCYQLEIDVLDSISDTPWSNTAAAISPCVDQKRPLRPDPGMDDRKGASAWPAVFLKMYNEARQKRSLTPLRLDPIATQVAAEHAQRFASDGKPRHDDNLLPELSDRGLHATRAEQIPDVIESADEAARWNVTSPARRAVIIDPSVGILGISCAPMRHAYACVQYLIVP